MKIVHVTAYYPPHIGGIENVVENIALNLSNKGIENTILTSDVPKDSPKYEETENLKIYRLKSFKLANTRIMFSLISKLANEIDNNTIVHVHAGHAFIPEISAFMSKLKGFPLIVHLHADTNPSGNMGFLLPIYKKYILKQVLSIAKKVIFLTNKQATSMSKKYGIPKNKIEVISNGINLNFFNNNKVKKSNKKINLLFVGRLSKEKNIPRLLKAIKIVLKKYNVTLHIVGDGKEKPIIEAIIKKEKIDKNIVLHGYLHGKDLRKIYNSSDIFVLPSDSEGVPLTIMEAMASGLPVVSSNLPGIRSFVKDCVLLVNRTPEDFAKGIIRLIEDKSLNESLKKRSYKLIKDYDWKIISKKFIEMYRKVLQE